MPFRSWPPMALVVLIAIAGAAPLTAVTPHLVKDINPFSDPGSSSPESFVEALGLVFFSASDGETGSELWRTDGTAQGTFRLTDVCPEECSSRIRFLARTSRSYFFFATGLSGHELWVTDGTPAHTLRLASFASFSTDGKGRVWIAGQDVVYFAADDGVHGLELWRTDGTPAGTFLVADIWPGGVGSEPNEMTEFNGKLFFRAEGGQQGPGLWQSDGTPGGTRLVRDLVTSTELGSGPSLLRVLGRTLYFVGPTPNRGNQIWRTDGTSRGTTVVTNLVHRTGSAETLAGLTAFGNRLFFIADTKAEGQELWATDGTAKGTRRLTNFTPVMALSSFDYVLEPFFPLKPFGGRLVFAANDGAHGTELWTTDGTPRGTRLFLDLCPGACAGNNLEFPVAHGNLLYFNGSDGVHGREPWVTDGTAAGTRIVRDLCAGSCNSTGYGFRAAGRWVYFQAYDGQRSQLWRTNGTAPGTVSLTPVVAISPRGIPNAVLGRSFVFTTHSAETGFELWKSDGTPQGTGLLADLNVRDLSGSYPNGLMAVGDEVYFYATQGDDYGLWKSDGTEAGTALFARIERQETDPPSPPTIGATVEMGGSVFVTYQAFQASRQTLWRLDASSPAPVRLTAEDLGVSPRPLLAAGGTLFFRATDEDHGQELWKTDGTVAGTRLVVDLTPGSSGSLPENLTAFQGRLYFTADSGPGARGLWRTDGTEAGTVLITEGIFSTDLKPLDERAGRLWFIKMDEEGGQKLASTDGTPEGTRVHDLAPGSSRFSAIVLAWDGSRFFLSGGTAEAGFGLWVWNGTEAAARRISGTLFSPAPFDRSGPVLANGNLYFPGFRQGSGEGTTLWKSDGTEAGTVQVLDRSGLPVSDVQFLQAFAGQVFFTTQGQGKLYQTDGTAAGTFPLLDLASPQGFGSSDLVRAGPRLFFSSADPATGTELWALEAE